MKDLSGPPPDRPPTSRQLPRPAPGQERGASSLLHITEEQTALLVEEELALLGHAAGRRDASDVTIFDNSGIGLQDL
ncbi:hypothetical protein [Streptomyces anthocyanicus]|uniref:hypothetical protein n=1 Tax=Streptomyces anthocyanicus TaxID=68174 RepID=UPI00382A33A9